jgi:CIC family chloride channel protein
MARPAWERPEVRAVVRLSLAAVALGVIGAVTAEALFKLMLFFTNVAFYRQATFRLAYPPDHLAPWMILIPALGGLLVGALAYYGDERIRGHGIPEAMEAIITKQSRLSGRLAVLKPLSAAIAVGTGGPFGAEGPIIQTGGAIGSVLGQALRLPAGERKVFLACGAAAGMTGIFNTPIAAVALSLELLLFEFRPRSLIPVIIASAVAAFSRRYLLGPGLMFPVPPTATPGLLALLLFVPLGVAVGASAVVVSKGLFRAEEWFKDRLRLSVVVAPAVGGLILGLIGYLDPRVLGMGYPLIGATLVGRLAPGSALVLAGTKSLALWAALGSGTSGGLLAPLLLIGSALGSAYGQLVSGWLPGAGLAPETCAIVGMSGLFGAAARVPVTSFLLGYELTGDYHALIPLMIGCMVADIVARLLTEYSVLTEPLARRGVPVPQIYAADVLSYLRVRALMRTDLETVGADTPMDQLEPAARDQAPGIADIAAPLAAGAFPRWLVTAPDGTVIGTISPVQLLEARLQTGAAPQSAGQVATPVRDWIEPEASVRVALLRMLRRGLFWLLVVEPTPAPAVLGYLALEDTWFAAQENLSEEVLRESILQPSVFQDGAEVVQHLRASAGDGRVPHG